MKLISFTKEHFGILISWVSSEDLLIKFAGTGFKYPITEIQLEQNFIKYPDRKFYLAVNDFNEPLAYGEIIPQDENSVRFGRLLVGNRKSRGKGLGKQLIQLLTSCAIQIYNPKNIDLFVVDGNKPAILCYLKCGFKFIPNDFAITVNNKSFDILKMTMVL